MQDTEDFVVQDNEQQLYKFTTEFNPNDRLQTEYNLLIKSAENVESTDLVSGTYLDSSNGAAVQPIRNR